MDLLDSTIRTNLILENLELCWMPIETCALLLSQASASPLSFYVKILAYLTRIELAAIETALIGCQCRSTKHLTWRSCIRIGEVEGYMRILGGASCKGNELVNLEGCGSTVGE